MTNMNTKNNHQTAHYLNWFLLFFLIKIIEKKDLKMGNSFFFFFFGRKTHGVNKNKFWTS